MITIETTVSQIAQNNTIKYKTEISISKSENQVNTTSDSIEVNRAMGLGVVKTASNKIEFNTTSEELT